MTAAPPRGRDEASAILSILGDPSRITDAKHSDGINVWSLEAAARAIAHDLKEPINGVRMLARWLGELVPQDDAFDRDRYLTLLESRLERLDIRHNALRRFIEAGLIDSTIGMVRIDEVFKEAAQRVQADTDKTVAIALQADNRALSLSTSRRAMFTCLYELLHNSAVHCERDTVRVTLRARTSCGARVLIIEDDGPGPREVDPETWFEPFYSRSNTYEGAGIGLAIVRRIVALRRGSVEIAGYDENVGTSVILGWPHE